MAVQFNAGFNRFVDFAIAQNASGKAIADAANGKFDAGGLARQVVVASDDKVGKLFRSQDAKDVNNVTRDIFHKAVADMFGGESMIPDSVKNAMNMKRFDGTGRPLSAKRIMIVKIAIDQYNEKNPSAVVKFGVGGPGGDIITQGLNDNAAKMNGVKAMNAASAAKDAQPAALTQAKAEKMIGKSISFLGYTFGREAKANLAALLVKYGSGMPAKNQRMLSNYIANIAITDGVDEEDIASVAKDMKTWSEFKFGDARLNKISAKLIKRQTNYVNDMLKQPQKFSEGNPNIFNQVYGDAERGDWNLNGKFVKNPSADTVVEALLKSVKNPNALKVITTLMNQGNLADIESLIWKSPALVGDANADDLNDEKLHTIPGGELFISREGKGIVADHRPSYGFEISKDGKTATVTVTIDKDISSNGSKYNEYKIGTARISQRTKIDLTKPMPEIVDVTFSQTYSSDKKRHNPNVKAVLLQRQ